MKVAFQVEGPTDLKVFTRLVSVILRTPLEVHEYRKRRGGVGEVFRTLEKSVWDAWAKGCRGAVISVDADDTTRHAEHEDAPPDDCRYCEVRRRLPSLPDRDPDPAFTFAVAVPVEVVEAWLLQFGHLVERRVAGPPQNLARRDAKRTLWDTVEPPPSKIEAVLDAILPNIGAAEIDQLAAQQPSFAAFRDEVARWRA